jgi:hypothetical protein
VILLQSNVTVLPSDVVGVTRTEADPWTFVAGALVAGTLAWAVVGNHYFLEGETMERPATSIAQLYGYTICLIAVIIFLVSVHSIAEAVLTLGNPLASEFPGGASLSSFEAYKATYNEPNFPYASQSPAHGQTAPTDAELKRAMRRCERIA